MGGKRTLAGVAFPSDEANFHSVVPCPFHKAVALLVGDRRSIRRLPPEGKGSILRYSPCNAVWRNAAPPHGVQRFGGGCCLMWQEQRQKITAAEAQANEAQGKQVTAHLLTVAGWVMSAMGRKQTLGILG